MFAKELREITVYHVPDGRLIEFASRLESVIGTVKLDGDPQHAGFHFRAAQEVADGELLVRGGMVKQSVMGCLSILSSFSKAACNIFPASAIHFSIC